MIFLINVLQKLLLFYCQDVDHFIPWSYKFEDELWNLVLTCRDCNLRKHGSLPQQESINNLVERNKTYSLMIEPLKRSLLKLDPDNNYERVIKRHFLDLIRCLILFNTFNSNILLINIIGYWLSTHNHLHIWISEFLHSHYSYNI